MPGSSIIVRRGSEVPVKIRLQIRSTQDGSLSEADLSGSPSLTWKAVKTLDDSPTIWLTKTSAASEITIITNGTSGTEAVIQFTLSEADLATKRKGFWITYMVKGGVTTLFEPGEFEIRSFPAVT